MAHEYNPNVQDEGDPAELQAEAAYQNRVLDEQVAQRWIMVYGFLIGFILLSALSPAINNVTRPYPQVMFIVAAVVTGVALILGTKSRERWADVLVVLGTLMMLFSVTAITPFGARIMEAIDPPEGVDPGNAASQLQTWLIVIGFAMLILFAVAWQSREWVVQGRRWFIRFALIWSVFVAILTLGFLAAVVVRG